MLQVLCIMIKIHLEFPFDILSWAIIVQSSDYQDELLSSHIKFWLSSLI